MIKREIVCISQFIDEGFHIISYKMNDPEFMYVAMVKESELSNFYNGFGDFRNIGRVRLKEGKSPKYTEWDKRTINC